jgi:hypothetical protein
VEVRKRNRVNPDAFPLDVYWKNCARGPNEWLNCKSRGNFKRKSIKECLEIAAVRRPNIFFPTVETNYSSQVKP